MPSLNPLRSWLPLITIFKKTIGVGTSKPWGIIALLGAMIIGGGCFDGSEKQNGKDASLEKLQGKIHLTGSSTMAPLVTALGRRFQAMHPGVVIEVATGGSALGIHDVREGTCEIGMVGRALKNDERDLIGLPIARDGVCLILHKDNPVKSLSSEQIIGIYTGKITNWKAAGGNDAPITAINRSEGRAQRELFTHFFEIKNEDFKVA